jgi:hypothetical protein
VVAALGVLLALAFGEVVARIEGPRLCSERRGVLLAADPEVGWTFAPGLTVTLDPCIPLTARGRWSAPVAINEHGLHDQPWTYDKRPGEVRLLLLGDEVADGVGLARADRLSVRLAHLSDSRRGAKVSVVNATIPGYGPAEALRFLERRGVRYAPDVVVLLVDGERDLAATLDPPEPALEPGDVPPASGLVDLSGIARWLAGTPAVRSAPAVKVQEPEPLASDGSREEARARLREIVARMATVSGDAGARLALAIAPRCPTFAAPPGGSSLCEDLGDVAPCVDLTSSFVELERGAPGDNELCIPGEPRWGRDGHFLASHKIWNLLAEKGLWPATVVRAHRL